MQNLTHTDCATNGPATNDFGKHSRAREGLGRKDFVCGMISLPMIAAALTLTLRQACP